MPSVHTNKIEIVFYLEKLETVVVELVCHDNMQISTKRRVITKFSMNFVINMVGLVHNLLRSIRRENLATLHLK
jgi:hypothetical protein